MKRSHAGIAIVALAVPVAACQLLVGIGDDNFTYVAPEAAASADAADAADAGPGDLCEHASPLARPQTADGPDGPTLVFALRGGTISGRNDAGAVAGFDLDKVCTCDPRDQSATQGQPTCVAPAGALRAGNCDHDGGVDNAAANIFDELSGFGQVIGDADDALRTDVECGKQTVILALLKYNGRANDPNVVVSLLRSNGIRDAHEGGERDAPACGPGGFAPYPAKWDGTDRWSVVPGSVTPERTPSRNLANGWVKDFRLILDLRDKGDSESVPLVFGSKVLSVASAVLEVRIVPMDAAGNDLPIDASGESVGKAASFRLADGTLTGRAPSGDILSAVGAFIVNGSGGGGGTDAGRDYLCNSPLLYPYLKRTVCSAADIMALPSRDFSGDSCDALSFVLLFGGAAAQIGSDYDPPLGTAGCGPQWQDSCSTP